MAERGEKYVPKNLVADVEDIKGTIKGITALMEPLAETMDSCEEAALMYQILGEELSKIRTTTLNKEKIIQLLEEKD